MRLGRTSIARLGDPHPSRFSCTGFRLGCGALGAAAFGLRAFPVAMAGGKHPFPFRTRKLSPPAPMVLRGRPRGRVGRRRESLAEGAGHRMAGALLFFSAPGAIGSRRLRAGDRACSRSTAIARERRRCAVACGSAMRGCVRQRDGRSRAAARGAVACGGVKPLLGSFGCSTIASVKPAREGVARELVLDGPPSCGPGRRAPGHAAHPTKGDST